jgi:hypothetical protein
VCVCVCVFLSLSLAIYLISLLSSFLFPLYLSRLSFFPFSRLFVTLSVSTSSPPLLCSPLSTNVNLNDGLVSSLTSPIFFQGDPTWRPSPVRRRLRRDWLMAVHATHQWRLLLHKNVSVELLRRLASLLRASRCVTHWLRLRKKLRKAVMKKWSFWLNSSL